MSQPHQPRRLHQPWLLYDVIHSRRDVRGEFMGAPVAPVALERVLRAAHAAPSVGLTHPWDFVLVNDPADTSATERCDPPGSLGYPS